MKWTKRRTFALLGIAAIAGTVMFCSPVYVLRAGYEEAKILSRRQPIQEVIEAPGTDSLTRAKLELVRSVRGYAVHELGLDVGDSYTTFSRVDSDTLLMVVTAAQKTAFVPYTWWFPIVGRVPYKGFFDPDDAFAQARTLERKGYDTHVRPSAAFSTLGWFNDPLLSTVLDRGDVSLASTVIHEVTHNTVFIPGQVAFNESLATFVGDVGAAEYFCTLDGEDGERCRTARAIWQDKMVFGEALVRLISALENGYGSQALTDDEKLVARDTVIDRWRERYAREVVPRLRVAFRSYHQGPLNNATLIGLRLYYRDLDVFDRVWKELGLPLDEAIDRMAAAAESSPEEPFEVHYDDFDGNGSKDIVLIYYNFGEQFPLRGRSCSSEQVPMLKNKFPSYNKFASANLTEVYGEDKLEQALHYSATSFASMYIENLGSGSFRATVLPNEAQISSINDFIVEDLNGDGHADVLLAGNLFTSEVETPRNDAGTGLVLLGDGTGSWKPVHPAHSGLYVPSDVKNIRRIRMGEERLLLFGVNNGKLEIWREMKNRHDRQ